MLIQLDQCLDIRNSHDERFITNTSNQLWVCADKKVTKFMGDVESYKVSTLSRGGGERERRGAKDG